MKSTSKTKVQLIEEITSLRDRLASLEDSHQKLSKDYTRLRTCMDRGMIAIAAITPDGRWFEYNDRFREMLGYTSKELSAKSWMDLTPPEDLPEEVEWVRQAAHGQLNHLTLEKRFIRKDGQIITTRAVTAVIPGSDGQIECVFGLVEDVTEQKQNEEDLERTRFCLDHASEASYWVDRDSRIVYCNDAASKMTGYSKEELLSMNIGELYPAYRAEEWPEFWKGLTERKSAQYESMQRRKDGSAVPVEADINCFEFRGRQYMHGAVRDITARRQAEEALRLTQTCLDTASEPCMWIDSDSRIVYANEAMCRLTGYSAEEICALSLDHIDPTVKDRWPELWKQIRQAERVTFERPTRLKDGTEVLVEVHVAFFEYMGRELLCTFGRDVSDRKRDELRLKESEATARVLLNAPADAILLLDMEGRILSLNDVAAEWFKMPPKDVVGLCCYDLLPEDVMPGAMSHVEEMIRSRKPVRFENERRGRAYEHLISPVLEPEGDIRRFAVHVRDITERKQAEDILYQHQAELAHASRLSALGQMATEIAHELNQPLSAICNYAEACKRMLMAGNTGELQGILDRIAAQSERAARVIQRIKGFSRKQLPQMTSVDINNLIREVVAMMETDLKRESVKTRLVLSPNKPHVWADSIQIQQVILNLAQNAVEAMGQIGAKDRRLTIESKTNDEGMVTVRVCDTGTGFGTVTPEQVFDPFFTTKPVGLGMGLAISRSIVQAHGGRLWASANSDRGASFHLTLPRSKEFRDVQHS